MKVQKFYTNIKYFFLATFFILLSGCSKQLQSPKDPVVSFSCEADVSMNNKNIKCKLNRTSEKLAEITITYPPELEGMSFKWSGDSYSISYKQLSCKTEEFPLPNNSFATSIINMLNQVAKPESLSLTSSQEELTIFSGNSDSGKFEVGVEKSTGLIKILKLDELNLKCSMFNYN